jgi:hypothetical protein
LAGKPVIETITYQEYQNYIDQYYKNTRWNYYQTAIQLIHQLNPQEPTQVLELGSRKFSLVKNCHTMEISNEYHPTFLYDATQTPWPIQNKQYQVFIALQVFEHLNNSQPQVFQEISRISNFAILSFPYLWNCPKDPTHHNISQEKISHWTNQHKPQESTLVHNRLVQLFRFDP